MMTGAATEWDWGWGSGGGWLCEPLLCQHCVEIENDTFGILENEIDDEADCEFDEADASADFGDFGF